eukprot:Em0015g1004a
MEAQERKKQRDKKRYANDSESKKSYEKARRLENRIIREEDERKKQSDKKGYASDNKKINPWRNESHLIGKQNTAEAAFNHQLSANPMLSDHHQRLQVALEAHKKVHAINEARALLHEAPVPQVPEDGLVQGEAKTAMEDVYQLNDSPSEAVNIDDMVAKLNQDQARVFDRIVTHLVHQKRHEDCQSTCSSLQPLYMFLSGVGGTGKSFLIHTFKAKIAQLWTDMGALTCALCAPTGLAAYNINGVTVHRLFQLPVEHEGKTSTYWPLPKESVKVMRNGFRHLKLIIIDEVSMLSSLNLACIHLRLEELFGGDQWFGGINILFVGDILQLPPVHGSPVFQSISNKLIATRLGCLTSVNIWHLCVEYDELIINQRQKEDVEFGLLLNDVRTDSLSANTIATLKNKVMTCTPLEKFQDLLKSGKSPLSLFSTRKACEIFNFGMLANLRVGIVEVPCIDETDETTGPVKWTKRAAPALQKLNLDCNLTAGLEAVLKLAVGARVMLRRNINTMEGLVNGALGTVKSIGVHCIHVMFDHNPAKECQIKRVRSKFQVIQKCFVYRKQFPLILAFAVTIHKCQGLSLDCAIIDLSSDVFTTVKSILKKGVRVFTYIALT